LNGDGAAALKYLESASTVPEPGSYFVSSLRLLKLMLRQGGSGAREAVLAYCERESEMLSNYDEGVLARLAQELRKA
jgi:hypothetical protein